MLWVWWWYGSRTVAAAVRAQRFSANIIAQNGARPDYQKQVRSITHALERVLLNLFLFRQNLHNEGGKKPGNR